ncbi:MAG: UDP-3-O-(3-hydroxymyristoyl)glucosamine N-acyltransferase [Muribaculaceae bacterium]|nr:UDP-3-O-(3-hydroxymyristoyl)glucosamine N-acyltransferase [Muribaculaceae bacterium]
MNFSITIEKLATLVNGEIEGDSQAIINGYSKIEEATEGCLTFLANPKYTHYIYTTKATAVLVRRDFVPEHPIQTNLIKVDDPYETLAKLLNIANSQLPVKQGIETPSYIDESVKVTEGLYVGAFAYIGKNVKLGKNVKVYPQVYVGDNVTLGDNVIIYPGVKIYHGCKIGNNCIIQAGAIIGADGFGFAPKEDGTYEKIAQVGIVILEDNVEVGANTTIDRATMGATVIKKGAKLDNLIQIAHNVEIGEDTVMAAQVGVAGSTKIGKHNMVGGQVGFAGHITIGDNNGFGAQSGIPNSVGSNLRLIGSPAINALEFARQNVYFKRLPQLNKDIEQLKKLIDDIKKEKQ